MIPLLNVHDLGLKKGLSYGYTFDESHGNILKDVRGSNHLIIKNGAAALNGEGVVNKSIRFLGKRAASAVSSKPILLYKNFTISFWLKLNERSANKWHFTFREFWRTPESNSIQVIQYGTTDLRVSVFRHDGSALSKVLVPGGVLETNKYYHILIKYNNGIFEVYLDGVLSMTCEDDNFESYQRLRLGNSVTGSFPTKSNVDNLYIWNRALREVEIAQLYNNGNGLTYNNFK